MENLQNYIFMDVVPPSWSKLAYPSNLPLLAWFNDLLLRQNELSNWTADFSVNLKYISLGKSRKKNNNLKFH